MAVTPIHQLPLMLGSQSQPWNTFNGAMSMIDSRLPLQSQIDLWNAMVPHMSNTNNPHSVTKAQVGLGSVPNVDATQRGNHSGTQLANTISDFAGAVDARISGSDSTGTSIESLLTLGKSGGRTISGGRNAGESLFLRSTSHASQGRIYLGDKSYFDDVTERIGLSTLFASYDVSIGGETTRTLGVERRTTTASPNGNTMVVVAGGCKIGVANASGGDLILRSGPTTGSGSSGRIQLQTPNIGASGSTSDNPFASRVTVEPGGEVGVGVGLPDGWLVIRAGDATHAPLKLINGALLSTPQAGAFEYSGSQAYITEALGGILRRNIVQANGTQFTSSSALASNGCIKLWIDGVEYKLLTTA